MLVVPELLGDRPHRCPDRRICADSTRVWITVINTNALLSPLGPMPATIANQQNAAATPFKRLHSDAFTHQPFNSVLGQMNSTLLL